MARSGGAAEVVVGGEGAPFAEVAGQRVRGVQGALVELLASVGLKGAKPADVSRGLGVDKTLAWRVSRFVEDGDPSQAARYMPGSAGVEIVCKAALKHGAGEPVVKMVREADRVLREFVERHARDRRSFEAMLAGGGGDSRLEQEERRAFFRAGSTVWGVRARVQLLMLALRPSEQHEGKLDVVQLGGLVDFERLRADVPWIIRRLHVQDPGTHGGPGVVREPLVPGASGGASLFPMACSDPIPEIRQFTGDDGLLYDELAAGPVGRGAAISCVTGEVYRGPLSYLRGEGNERGTYMLAVRTPVEAVIFDLLFHESLAHWSRPVARCAGLMEDRPRVGGAPPAAAPLMETEPARALGSPPVMPTARLPAYASWVSEALRIAGWGDTSSYRGFRHEVEYPPSPCMLTMETEIGER